MRLKTLAALAAVAISGAVTSVAHADHVRPNLGIEVTAVDPSTRTVDGIQHCTSPDRAGRPVRFTVTRDIEFNQFFPGVFWGIAVTPEGVILSTGEMPCEFRPPRGPGGPHVGPDPQGGPEGFDDPAEGLPDFGAGLLNRVWKFNVDIDGSAGDRLSVTIDKVLNMPKKFADEEEELVDQDAIVLTGGAVRVYHDGKRVGKDQLEDAESARVHGKLLPPRKWETDQDEQKVPTIRAKKIHLS